MTEREALKLAMEALEVANSCIDGYYIPKGKTHLPEIELAITSIKEALAQPEQEPVAWKLVPIKPTDEMLKAMDECSTEGYDERLYAGHAASVYMAAVDVAPTPPQLKEPEQEPVAWATQMGEYAHIRWGAKRPEYPMVYEVPLYTSPPQRKPLTDEEIAEFAERMEASDPTDSFWREFARAIEAAHGI